MCRPPGGGRAPIPNHFTVTALNRQRPRPPGAACTAEDAFGAHVWCGAHPSAAVAYASVEKQPRAHCGLFHTHALTAAAAGRCRFPFLLLAVAVSHAHARDTHFHKTDCTCKLRPTSQPEKHAHTRTRNPQRVLSAARLTCCHAESRAHLCATSCRLPQSYLALLAGFKITGWGSCPRNFLPQHLFWHPLKSYQGAPPVPAAPCAHTQPTHVALVSTAFDYF